MDKKIIKILVVFLLFVSCKSNKVEIPSVQGMIYNGDNEAVSDVVVYIDDKKNAFSDIYGHFILSDIEIGNTYTIKASKNGYEEIYMSFTYSNPSQVIYFRMFSANELLYSAEEKVEQKEYKKAEEYLKRAETAGGSFLSINYLRAVIKMLIGDYDKALETANKIIEEGYTEPYLYILIADIYKNGFNDINNEQLYLQKFLKLTYDPKIQERLISE